MISTHYDIDHRPAVDRNDPPQGGKGLESEVMSVTASEKARSCGEDGERADVTCNARSHVTSSAVTPPRAQPRWRLTTTDLGMLSFLARHRYATVAQLGRRYGRSAVHVRRRTSLMIRDGYIASLPVRPFEGWVYLPTTKGIAVSGLALPTPEYTPVTHDHTLGCVDLAIAYELSGVRVISEREARAPALAERDWSLPGPGRSRAYPDLVVVRDDEAEAVELELHAKSPTLWSRKLEAYAGSTYRRVTYWLPDRSLSQRFAKAVEVEGLTHLVRIRRFEPGGQPQV